MGSVAWQQTGPREWVADLGDHCRIIVGQFAQGYNWAFFTTAHGASTLSGERLRPGQFYFTLARAQEAALISIRDWAAGLAARVAPPPPPP